MGEAAKLRPVLQFGPFELDQQSGQLRKHGVRIKLQDQPLQILALLIESPGQLVTREQIQKKLWSGDTFVDFDNAINSAVRKIRDALRDDSENPRFIETVARRGYRFVAPVLPRPETVTGSKTNVTDQPQVPHRRLLYSFVVLGGALAFVCGAVFSYWLRPRLVEQPVIELLTWSGRDFLPAVSPDGKTIAFTSDRDGTPRIWVKQTEGGGEVVLTSGPDGWPRYSPDGSAILFSRSHGQGRSLYKVASVGGQPRRLLDDALNGDFSPDVRHIAFVRSKRVDGRLTSVLAVSASDGSGASHLAEVPDVRLDSPRWSPDGKAIAVIAAGNNVSAEIYVEVWIFRPDGKQIQRLRVEGPERGVSSVAWLDARTVAYVHGDRTTPVNTELILHDTGTGKAVRQVWPCCSVSLDIAGPGKLVFDQQATRSGLLEVERGGTPAHWISHSNSADRQPVYSPDGKRVAFSSNRDGHMNLWQIALDTGTVTRLTEGRATDYDPAFSPDGNHLIFTSDRGGHFEIYMANADGSAVRQVTNEGVDAENATMTSDSKWLVYASSHAGRAGIWKVRPDGTEATRLVHGIGNNPEVSPDGVFALYLTAREPDTTEIRVIRVSDGSDVPPAIQCRRRKQNGMAIGRARWVPSPDRKTPLAIAFVGQDETGATGVYTQDFVPGRDTSLTRKPLRPFDAVAPLETLGVSPDGKRFVVSVADDTSSIMSASHAFPR
jgi:Tol biopolymer transport system component/DNA-binding winged helix-turn-helix (wHTH) protein